MEFFDRQWATYRAVVDADLMEHRALSAATAEALRNHCAQRPSHQGAPHMVDLGCGDLGLLAPVLQQLPLGSYTGLDLTAAVLPLAQKALGAVPYPVEFQQGDLLHWANQAHEPSSIDILHSSFAIHHLDGLQKTTLLGLLRPTMAEGSIFLWADVFREPGESRDSYVARYAARIRSQWTLDAAANEQVISHLSSFDNPEDRFEIAAAAEAHGWSWQWLWQGQHQAEALALLRPI